MFLSDLMYTCRFICENDQLLLLSSFPLIPSRNKMSTFAC